LCRRRVVIVDVVVVVGAGVEKKERDGLKKKACAAMTARRPWSCGG
jgi:hypothetical protein